MQSRINKKSVNLKVSYFCWMWRLITWIPYVSFKIINAFDNWQPAIQVYNKNFHDLIHNYDLSSLNDNYSCFVKFSVPYSYLQQLPHAFSAQVKEMKI